MEETRTERNIRMLKAAKEVALDEGDVKRAAAHQVLIDQLLAAKERAA